MERAVRNRGIEFVFHFTKIDNLDSIFKDGLIPRSILEVSHAEYSFNDHHRIDGHQNASCLSVGHPNYKMFYRLRQENINQEWVVIVISAVILWQKDCAFCHENAASNSVRVIPIHLRKGVAAFERMFDPVPDKPDRATLGLPDRCPTNPQAEILVFDTIEPKFIVGAVVQSRERERELSEKHPKFQFMRVEGFFKPRIDFASWR